MPNNSANNKRIAKNTLMLYLRMLFLMVVHLYTSRVVLRALGVEDYGIYNAVGGFVAMFSMISTSLSGAISRYITFSLAKDSMERLKVVFSTTVIIQFILCALFVVFGETVALWFLNYKMVIPEGRVFAANWVLQLSVITFVVNLMSLPYNALLIAHERMSAFAYIGIYEGCASLCIALLISISPIDALIFYALLMCLVSVSIRLLYGRYCSHHFEESRFQWTYDRTLIRELFGFAGWNFVGTASGVLRSQGINILINLFCGPAVNAARGLAMQVNRAISQFSANFTTAVRPQITKSYAVGDRKTYETLCMKCSRFSFLILMVLCLPIIFEADYIMKLWLVEVPQYATEFVQIILILTLVESYSHSLIYLLLATGDIKKYQLLVGGIQLLNFPLAYIILKLGITPVATVGSVIFVALICLALRLKLVHDMMSFPVLLFLKRVILRTITVFVICMVPAFIITVFLQEGWLRLIVNILIIELVCAFVILSIGMTKGERNFVFVRISNIIKNVKKI